MKHILIIALLLASTTAYADCKKKDPCEPKPKVVYKTVTVKEHVQTPAKADAAAKTTVGTAAKALNQAKAANQTQASTGHQTITINMPHPERTRVVHKTRYRAKYVNVTNPNRLQLLLGLSKTKLQVEETDCCTFKAKREYEPDLGLQYLRDFGGFTGSIMGTTNRSLYLGLGFNW